MKECLRRLREILQIPRKIRLVSADFSEGYREMDEEYKRGREIIYKKWEGEGKE